MRERILAWQGSQPAAFVEGRTECEADPSIANPVIYDRARFIRLHAIGPALAAVETLLRLLTLF